MDDRQPTHRGYALLRHIARVPLVILVALSFLIDDVVFAAIRPVFRWLAELRLFARLGEAIHRLPPYPSLLLFLIPFAAIWPPKLYAVYLMATGHFVAGLAVYLALKVFGFMAIERLFHVTRDKLLSIGWFAWCYGKVMGWRDWAFGIVKATRAWQVAAAFAKALKARLRGLLGRVRAALAPFLAAAHAVALRFGRWLRTLAAR